MRIYNYTKECQSWEAANPKE